MIHFRQLSVIMIFFDPKEKIDHDEYADKTST